MKTLELKDMETLQAGGPGAQCNTALAGALVFGAGAVIFAAATGGLGGIAFAMAGNYFGWGMAAWTCY